MDSVNGAACFRFCRKHVEGARDKCVQGIIWRAGSDRHASLHRGGGSRHSGPVRPVRSCGAVGDADEGAELGGFPFSAVLSLSHVLRMGPLYDHRLFPEL